MAPVDAICSRKYHAVHYSGVRDVNVIKWIVLHDEEASTAEAAAQWFTNPDSAGSAHLCVDDTTCYRTLLNEEVAWGAPGANTNGFHIEQAGFAKWSTVIWKRHRLTLQRAAYKTALHCVAFELPPTFVKADGLKAGHKGVTTHAECSKAFGGDHTDPGFGWPRFYFMKLVRDFYAELNA